MSVFVLNANEDEEVAEEQETVTVSTVSQTQSEANQALSVFWSKVGEEVKKIKVMDLKVQALPLARIKKIMKLDEDVKMISAEAPVLFAKAAEIFIHELTLRAWIHTEDNKRRTLQRNDIAMAITKYDQFDFLIDIVPRDEVKPTLSQIKTENTTARVGNQDQLQYYFQLAQQTQQAMQTTNDSSTTQTVTTVTPAIQTGQVIPVQPQPQQGPGNIQIVHQIVAENGAIQNIPVQLSQQQVQLIRMQLQSNSNQPIILQSAPPGATNSIIQM